MATKNLTKGGTTVLPAHAGLPKLISRTIDHSITANQLANADVAQVINVPANTFVLFAGHKVHTVQGAAAAGTLGDGADVDGYLTASDLNALGVQKSALALTEAAPNTVTGYSNGKFYSAADTIDFVAGAAVNAAKVTYFALMVDLDEFGD